MECAAHFEICVEEQTYLQICGNIALKLYCHLGVDERDYLKYTEYIYLTNICDNVPKAESLSRMWARNERDRNIGLLRFCGDNIVEESEEYFSIIRVIDEDQIEHFGYGITIHDIFEHIPMIGQYYMTGFSHPFSHPLTAESIREFRIEKYADEREMSLLNMRGMVANYTFHMEIDIILAIRQGQNFINELFGRGVFLHDIFRHFPMIEEYFLRDSSVESEQSNSNAKKIVCILDSNYISTTECVICYETVSNVELKCSHEFCKGCIIQYIQRKKQLNTCISCPMCRTEVEELKTSCEEMMDNL